MVVVVFDDEISSVCIKTNATAIAMATTPIPIRLPTIIKTVFLDKAHPLKIKQIYRIEISILL